MSFDDIWLLFVCVVEENKNKIYANIPMIQIVCKYQVYFGMLNNKISEFVGRSFKVVTTTSFILGNKPCNYLLPLFEERIKGKWLHAV